MRSEKVNWLNKYRFACKEIDRIERELERWRSIAEKITPALSAVPGGNSADGTSMERAVEKIAELEKEMAEWVIPAAELRMQIEAAINTVQQPFYREVLKCRYIEDMSWPKAASKLHYSSQYLRMVHMKAVDALIMQ